MTQHVRPLSFINEQRRATAEFLIKLNSIVSLYLYVYSTPSRAPNLFQSCLPSLIAVQSSSFLGDHVVNTEPSFRIAVYTGRQ
jgi:hypothetical protein